jgi:hypothetical protein
MSYADYTNIGDIDPLKFEPINNATVDMTFYGQDNEPMAKNVNIPSATDTGRYPVGWSAKNLVSYPAFQNIPNYSVSDARASLATTDTKVAQAILTKFYNDTPWKDTKSKRSKKLRAASKKTTGWPSRDSVASAIDTLGQFQEKVAALDKLSPDNRMQVLARMLCDMPGMQSMLVRMNVCSTQEIVQITELARKIAIKRKNRL